MANGILKRWDATLGQWVVVGGGGAEIDDTTPSATTTYSSSKIESEFIKNAPDSLIFGGRFKLEYNSIDDSLDISVVT